MVTDADLDLVRRRVLGGPGDHRVSGQISLGRSEAIRLGPETAGLDQDLARALERDADHHRYYMIMFRCTFRTGSAPVVSARLSVALRQASVRGVADPVVWSMDPLRAATPVNHRRMLRLSPNIKILPETSEFGLAAEHSREYTSNLSHIVAQGEGESQVEWVFSKTEAVDLVGVYHLHLVARTSARVSCRAELALAATREEKRFGLVRYRAAIPAEHGAVPLAGL
ncbi:hypothetical protein [Pseudonocardia adelaidensis]|uniref:hypothetical protein n=1 Tax=Pseudonocardia adelaidensis TaxID=648754 RepID=UPI0031E597B9